MKLDLANVPKYPDWQCHVWKTNRQYDTQIQSKRYAIFVRCISHNMSNWYKYSVSLERRWFPEIDAMTLDEFTELKDYKSVLQTKLIYTEEEIDACVREFQINLLDYCMEDLL